MDIKAFIFILCLLNSGGAFLFAGDIKPEASRIKNATSAKPIKSFSENKNQQGLSSQPSQKKKITKIIILGDSLTEGYGIDQQQSYPSLLRQRFKKEGASVQIVNAGSSGSTSASAVSRLKWLLKSKPDILMLALGGNDGLRGSKLTQTQDNLDKSIQLALSQNIKVVLAGMQIPTNYGKDYSSQFKQVFVTLSKKYNVIFIPFLLEGVGGVKKYNLPDGIHPNQEGHKKIAQLVYPYLKKLL